jgi:hypothetical protein
LASLVGLDVDGTLAKLTIIDASIAAAGIGDDKKGPLFRTFKKGRQAHRQSDDPQ